MTIVSLLFYIDGVFQSSYICSYLPNGLLNTGNATPIVIGTDGTSRFFDGVLDDFRFWNRALTSCDIDSLYNMPNPCSLLSPVISANGPTTFCQGGSVTLDAGSWTSYLWS